MNIKKADIRRKFIFFAISLFVLQNTNLNAQLSGSMLWKISGKTLTTPSYLFGTMHVMCGENFELKPKVINVLKQVHTITFEADVEDIRGSEELEKLMRPVPGILDTANKTKLAFIDSVFKKNQLTLDLFNQLSPFGLMTLFTLKAFKCANPSEVKMMEKELHAIALDDSVQLDHLESVSSQMEHIKSMNTLDELIEALKNLNDYPEMMKNLESMYQTEDLPKLTQLMNDPKYMSALQQTTLLTNRNNNWVQLMPEKMLKASTLFAVGAAHLGGKNGLISLLQKEGFTVTPVFE